MSDFVDKEARENIERLERRLEGAHLTPSIWQIFKQSLQAIGSWNGWEVISLIAFTLLGIFLICLMVFGFNDGCNMQEVKRYTPACRSLGSGFEFAKRTQGGRIVCTGPNQVVSVDPGDLNDTEVFHLDTGKMTEFNPEAN